MFKGIGTASDKVNSVFGNIGAELVGKGVLPERLAQRLVGEALEKTRSSRALAERLSYSFVIEGNTVLHLADLEDVLSPDGHETAEKCFHRIGPDENGDIALEEMTLKVTELCNERKAIARSMHDVSQPKHWITLRQLWRFCCPCSLESVHTSISLSE